MRLAAFEELASRGGWLGGVALVAWAFAALLPTVALVSRRRSLVWVAAAMLAIGWLALLAPVFELCGRMSHLQAATRGGPLLWLALAYLHAGGASLTLAAALVALAFARSTSPLAAIPWLLLVVPALGALLYPRVFFEAYATFGSRRLVSDVATHGFALLDAAKQATLVLGLVSVAVAWARASTWAPRRGESIVWLVLGVTAFALTRGHAHDAAHPLPPHETAVDDLDVPFPEGRGCRRPAPRFGTTHTARFTGGLELDGLPVEDLEARLVEFRREWSVRHPVDPARMPLRFLERPRPEDTPVLRVLASAGFEPPELETVRRFQVRTATRGVVDLAERCVLPWTPWPPD